MADATDFDGGRLVTAGAVLLAICACGVITRCASIYMLRRPVWIEDALLLWAFILNVGQYGMFVWATQYAGWGHHIKTLTPAQLVHFSKVYLSTGLIQPCLLASAKLSVLIFLHRIFVTRGFRITAIILMAIVVAWWVATTLAAFLDCHPFNSFWGASPAHCGNQHLLGIIDPIPWILTDFAILVAPIPCIVKLNMATRSKVVLACIFLIGGLTCIVSCVRYRYVFFSFDDTTYDTIDLGIWQLVEANITVFCASVVASKPFAMLLIPDSLVARLGSFASRLTGSSRRQGSEVTLPTVDKHRFTVSSKPTNDYDAEAQISGHTSTTEIDR